MRPRRLTVRSNVQLDVSFTLDSPHQLALLVEVEKNVATGITLEISGLVALGKFDENVPLAAFAARLENGTASQRRIGP